MDCVPFTTVSDRVIAKCFNTSVPSSSEISLRTTHLKKEQAGIFVIIDVICGFFFLLATNGET